MSLTVIAQIYAYVFCFCCLVFIMACYLSSLTVGLVCFFYLFMMKSMRCDFGQDVYKLDSLHRGGCWLSIKTLIMMYIVFLYMRLEVHSTSLPTWLTPFTSEVCVIQGLVHVRIEKYSNRLDQIGSWYTVQNPINLSLKLF